MTFIHILGLFWKRCRGQNEELKHDPSGNLVCYTLLGNYCIIMYFSNYNDLIDCYSKILLS